MSDDALCVGGSVDGKRLPVNGSTRHLVPKTRTYQMVLKNPYAEFCIECDEYRLEVLNMPGTRGRVSRISFWILEPMTIYEAVQMLVNGYRPTENVK